MEAADRLIVALDVPDARQALALASKLEGTVRRVKVGLQLFCAEGPGVVTALVERGFGVMLDLKLHDIPATVEHATRSVVHLGAELLTVHTAGGRRMMEHAHKAARDSKLRLLGVTVLTAMDEADLREVDVRSDMADVVTLRARLAVEAGLAGVVASPREAAALRASLPAGALIVTPGVRPEGTATGDQKRVATPASAVADGADYLVVGRPVRDASDPAGAARRIIEELA